jgi:hypothetical protein
MNSWVTADLNLFGNLWQDLKMAVLQRSKTHFPELEEF